MTETRNKNEIENLAAFALEKALEGGASDADVLYSEGAGTGLSMKDGEVEESVAGSTAGIGVRTIMADGRQGIAFGNRITRDAVRELVEWSLSNCRNAEPEDGVMLYEGSLVEDPEISQNDSRISEITQKERYQFCEEMTRLAAAADKRVVSVRSAAWHDGSGTSYYRSTKGAFGWERGSSASCGVSVLVRDGAYTELGGYGFESRRFDELDIVKTAALAVSKTTALLGAKSIATGTYDAVIEADACASLVDAIADLFCAPEIHKGRSMMAGMLGESVASSCVTLVDDGRVPWKAGSSSWDAEGVPTGRTVLIDGGVANAYLYNLQYAYKDGVQSTGNACRGLSSLPDVGTTNAILLPGDETPESLIGRVKKGFYITEFMGLHTIDPVSGDFSIGAKGLLIERGALARPVSGVTIASNLKDFLRKIVAVGSDLQYFGAVAAPTLVVEDIVLAGE
ncbi:TldD/PmbA family protein [Synergistaceae bacterium OttesenSCG-928-D05]|nr:TldD/PmbA family protein [Synergistaceae bacterium OttesenSCG-928-D05]